MCDRARGQPASNQAGVRVRVCVEMRAGMEGRGDVGVSVGMNMGVGVGVGMNVLTLTLASYQTPCGL